MIRRVVPVALLSLLAPLLAVGLLGSSPPAAPPAPIAPTADGARVDRILASLSLDEKVDQMLLAYPQRNIEAPVTVGGVLFVGTTLSDTAKAQALITSDLSRAKVPPFFAVDMEGGAINRLKTTPGLESIPSPLAMAKLSDSEVEAWGYKVGVGMKSVGLNMNLAPVLDVSGSGHLFSKERTFGGDAAVCAAKGKAFAKGLQKAGIATIGKHYPGYGDLVEDSDFVLVTATWPAAKLASQVAVFDQVGSLLDGVMLSNVVYQVHGTKPAVLTSALVEAARKQNWLTVTDDLAIATLAQSISGSGEDVVRAAVLAGNDLLLTTAPPDWDKGLNYHKLVLDMVKQDPKLQTQVDASVRRILVLKDRLGMLK